MRTERTVQAGVTRYELITLIAPALCGCKVSPDYPVQPGDTIYVFERFI
jgi:hypothetical protein